jgi:hypothetical protein
MLIDRSTSMEEEEMRVWYRCVVLAGAALLWAGANVRAQIRETVSLPPAYTQKGGLTERPNHPVVLLHSREGEFTGGARMVAQLMFKQIDPTKAVEKVTPPKGIDGIIAYPESRMLMVHGTPEAVAGYRVSLEKLDREAATGKAGEKTQGPAVSDAASSSPVILLPAGAKLRLEADRVEQDARTTRATGHVVIGLPDGIELRAKQVRVTREGGQQRIAIEK